MFQTSELQLLLFKAGKSRQDISKSLKVKRMLVWRTLKHYEETGDIQNRPGQGRPKTARTFGIGTLRIVSVVSQEFSSCKTLIILTWHHVKTSR